MDYFASRQEREWASQHFGAFRELGFNYGYQHHTMHSWPAPCSLCDALHMALYLVLPRGPASVALLTRVASHRVDMAARVPDRCLCRQACSPSCVMDTSYVNNRLEPATRAYIMQTGAPVCYSCLVRMPGGNEASPASPEARHISVLSELVS